MLSKTLSALPWISLLALAAATGCTPDEADWLKGAAVSVKVLYSDRASYGNVLIDALDLSLAFRDGLIIGRRIEYDFSHPAHRYLSTTSLGELTFFPGDLALREGSPFSQYDFVCVATAPSNPRLCTRHVKIPHEAMYSARFRPSDIRDTHAQITIRAPRGLAITVAGKEFMHDLRITPAAFKSSKRWTHEDLFVAPSNPVAKESIIPKMQVISWARWIPSRSIRPRLKRRNSSTGRSRHFNPSSRNTYDIDSHQHESSQVSSRIGRRDGAAHGSGRSSSARRCSASARLREDSVGDFQTCFIHPSFPFLGRATGYHPQSST